MTSVEVGRTLGGDLQEQLVISDEGDHLLVAVDRVLSEHLRHADVVALDVLEDLVGSRFAGRHGQILPLASDAKRLWGAARRGSFLVLTRSVFGLLSLSEIPRHRGGSLLSIKRNPETSGPPLSFKAAPDLAVD